MIKLIENELVKIFKRKSIYLIFLVFAAIIIGYNIKNPDQNKKLTYNMGDIQTQGMKEYLKEMEYGSKDYCEYKARIDFLNLYNSYEKKSWQKNCLNEQNRSYADENSNVINDIENVLLFSINDYESNSNSEITKENYENCKTKFEEYKKALDDGNWQEFLNLKIKNLQDMKKDVNNISQKYIDVEIEICQYRLSHNINFEDNIQNEYLKEYREDSFLLISRYNSEIDTFNQVNSNLIEKSDYNFRQTSINLCKYAIENDMRLDISNENNILINNEINARISLIRTFKHFDILLVIVAIYVSSTIVTEEVNNKTIKKLLTKPHKRSKILIAKMLTTIITIVISMIFIAIIQFIVGGIIYGFDSYNVPYIGYDLSSEKVVVMSVFEYLAIVCLLKIPMYAVITLFCMFIGINNKYVSMSMILTLIAFLILTVIIKQWSEVEALSVVTRFFVTNNWDFTTYLWGNSSRILGVNLLHSALVCIAHLAFLLFISIKSFNKKEIVNV